VDFERTLETQRHRLLRIVAGLVLVVGVLAVGPVSRRFSDWTLGFVGSILSRAEAAAKYLIIAQARLMMSRGELEIDEGRIFERLARITITDETDITRPECERRLKILRAVLLDLPRHAARLLHRIEKQMCRASSAVRQSYIPKPQFSASLDDWQLAESRVERPPDKGLPASPFILPPPDTEREAKAVGPLFLSDNACDVSHSAFLPSALRPRDVCLYAPVCELGHSPPVPAV